MVTRIKKGVSEILGAVIVTAITIALGVPLVLYATSLNSANSHAIGGAYQKVNNALSTEFTIVQLGDTPNQTYLYNFGTTPIQITQLIVNNVSVQVSFTLKPNQIVSLHTVYSKIPNKATVLILANGNWYSVSI